MFDASKASTGPRLRISATNGARPSPGRKPVVTGTPATMYGGPETRGLHDWDEPAEKVKTPREPRIPVAHVLHRLRRPDGTCLTTEVKTVVVGREVIADVPIDAEMTKQRWNTIHAKVIKHYGTKTVIVDDNPWIRERKRKLSPRGTVISMERVHKLVALAKSQGLV